MNFSLDEGIVLGLVLLLVRDVGLELLGIFLMITIKSYFLPPPPYFTDHQRGYYEIKVPSPCKHG